MSRTGAIALLCLLVHITTASPQASASAAFQAAQVDAEDVARHLTAEYSYSYRSFALTASPSSAPSRAPTVSPSSAPSRAPTVSPSSAPSRTPTVSPTNHGCADREATTNVSDSILPVSPPRALFIGPR